MHHGRIGRKRWALSVAVGTVVACATMAVTTASALAGGVSVKHSYTVNISPATVPAGKVTTLDVALSNTSSPGGVLSSAELLPPLGFRVVHASLPSGASGRAHVILNIVVLDHLSVPPGSTLHVSVTVAAPPKCHTFFNRWLTDANTGGLFSQDLRLDLAHSSLTTDVSCITATGLKFDTQPNDTLINDNITGNQYDTAGPPVTVDIVDSGGNVVDSSAPVTIALGNNPAGATLGGTLTRNAVHGVATFDDLTLDQPDNGYTLTASSSGLTNDTSNSFNENNTSTPCPSGSTCTNTVTSGSGSFQVDVGGGSTGATLTTSVDVGTPMDGPGSNPDADPGCANFRVPEASANWYEFVVQPADGETFDRGKTITWTVKGTSDEPYTAGVCFGAPYEFDAIFTNSGLAPAGTLPDGSQGFVGLLGECSELTTGSPCISNLSTQEDPTTGEQEAVIVVTIPAGLPGDPWMGR